MDIERGDRPTHAFKNIPRDVVKVYSDAIFSKPQVSHIDIAAEIITNNPPIVTYGFCVDLSTQEALATQLTPTLAHIFTYKPELLPENWSRDMEIWRTVFSMSSEIDLGYLKAQLRHPETPSEQSKLKVRISMLTLFLKELHEKIIDSDPDLFFEGKRDDYSGGF